MVLTITDRTRRYHLEVWVTSVDKLLVDSVAFVWVHNTCSVDLGVGEILEYPFAGRFSIFGVDDKVKTRGFLQGESVGADGPSADD